LTARTANQGHPSSSSSEGHPRYPSMAGGIAETVVRSAVVAKRDWGRKRTDNSRQATERKAALRVAYIGAAATLSAAIIGGIFVLVSSSNHDSPGNGIPTGSYSYGSSPAELAILSVSFGQVGTREIISVTGVARNVPAHLSVYAVAKPGTTNAKTPALESGTNTVSWFVAGPAAVAGNGLWSVKINISPPETGKLTIAAVEARNLTSPQCAPGETCAPPPPPPPTAAQVEAELSNQGSGTTIISRTSSSKRVTIPSR
jgi:hypothetical protein